MCVCLQSAYPYTISFWFIQFYELERLILLLPFNLWRNWVFKRLSALTNGDDNVDDDDDDGEGDDKWIKSFQWSLDIFIFLNFNLI